MLPNWIITSKMEKLYQITRFSLLPEMPLQSMSTMPKWVWSALLRPQEVLAVSLPFSLLLLKN